MESMIEMDGLQRAGQAFTDSGGGVQEHSGIQTATEGDPVAGDVFEGKKACREAVWIEDGHAR